MLGQWIEIGLLGSISGNTSAIAQSAASPEFVKEANWLANGFFVEIRRDSRLIRFMFDASMLSLTTMTYFGAVDFNSSPVKTSIVIVIIWMIINKYFKQSAARKALNQAWSIIREKQVKQDTITEMMYQAAQVRMKVIN
jgi:hypothetical protein